MDTMYARPCPRPLLACIASVGNLADSALFGGKEGDDEQS